MVPCKGAELYMLDYMERQVGTVWGAGVFYFNMSLLFATTYQNYLTALSLMFLIYKMRMLADLPCGPV